MSQLEPGVEWPARALLAGVTVLLFGAVFFGGGPGDDALATWGVAAVLAAAAAIVAAAVGRLSLPRLDRAGALAALCAVGLVSWVGVSIAWSIAGDHSWSALGKGLVYLAFLLLGLCLSASLAGRAARGAATCVALVLAAALGWALLARAVPALFEDGGRIARLREPVGYWNALALLAGAAVPLGLWVAAARGGRVARPLGALLVYAAVLVTMLSQSRAGLVALAVGLTMWLTLSSVRLQGGLLCLMASGPALAVAAWAFTRPSLVEDGALRADRVRDGTAFAMFALAGAAITALLAHRVPADRLVADDPRRIRRGLIRSAVTIAAVGLAALVVAAGNPLSWASDQVSGGECANTPGRLLDPCANNRPAWWEDAFQIARDRPVGGTGALTYEIARLRVRDDAVAVVEPHSVPLQLLSDLGLVGLALGLAFAVAAALGARNALRRLDGAEREAAVALAAFPAVYGVHAFVDYDLDFLAVTAPALVALGALLAVAQPRTRLGSPLVVSGAAVVTSLAVAAVLVAPALARRDVDRSTLRLDEGLLVAAANAANRAQRFDPLSLEPVYATAAVADAVGDTDSAIVLYRRATNMQPENPEPWVTLGRYEFIAHGDMCQAYFALNAAYTLDPKSRRWVKGGPLDQARDAVNAGACEP